MSHVFPRHCHKTPPTAVRGEGCYLYDSTGKEYLDGSGGAAVSCLGHGDADVMAGPEGSQAFFDALGSEDKTLDFWPVLYHEIFNEPESEEVMTRYVSWLQAHL